MKDESVWYKQIDTALVKYLSENLSTECNGIKTAVPSSVRKSEEDFKVESYPCTSVYCLSSVIDYDRLSNQTVNRYLGENCLINYPVIPFKLQYQIDFWTKYQTQRDILTSQWLRLHSFGTRLNLPVLDASGVERLANMSLSGSIVNQDDITGVDRLFRSIFTYNIWAEIDNVAEFNVPAVKQINFNTGG